MIVNEPLSPPRLATARRFEEVDLVLLGNEEDDEITEVISSGRNYVFELGDGGDYASVKSITEDTNLYLNTGSGDDQAFLEGSFGKSTVFGGHGKDKIRVVSSSNSNLLISGGEGRDRIYSNGSILGGAGNDVLKASTNSISRNVSIWGGQGKDVIRGSSVDDYLDGGDQGDVLSGKEGNDLIIGAKGSDKLNGGLGADYLNGGSGNDTLIGGDGADIFDIGDDDVIKDFSPREGDMIYINELTFGSNILSEDIDNGTVLSSDSGIKVLIKGISSFAAQSYINFY